MPYFRVIPTRQKTAVFLPRYDFGVSIDLSLQDIQQEHDHLHQILKAIEEALREWRVNDQDLLRLLDLLAGTLEAHFRGEERLMAEMSYPQLSDHTWQHDVLAEHLGTLCSKIRAGEWPTVRRLVAELRHLVIDHADQADCEFIAHVIAARIPDGEEGWEAARPL